MQTGSREQTQLRRTTKLEKADRPPQCNQIKNKVAWKNKKFTFKVCATDAKKAAEKVTEQMMDDAIVNATKVAVKPDCSGASGCGDTQQCQEQDIVWRKKEVTKKPAAAFCRPDATATCPAPET